MNRMSLQLGIAGRGGSAGRFLSAGFAAALLASCASLPVAAPVRGAVAVVKALQSGNPDALMSVSSRPFVLDGEIISLADDIAFFWSGLAGAGLDLTISGLPWESGLADAAAAFGTTMEVNSFFARYVPPAAAAIVVPTAAGELMLLLGHRRPADGGRRLPTVYGLRGPTR